MYDTVFHLADLHIRRGNEQNARYEEYREVFERCVAAIRERSYGKKCAVVICGDIFHHKLEIAPAGIRLFYDLIHSLGDMMKVLIIQGNHDLLQQRDTSENNDLIEALLLNNSHWNVIYLKDTGLYRFDNLEIGVVSIRDILRSGASSGMVDALPPFPTPTSSPGIFKIALAHCTVKNCMLSATQKSLEGVPVEWFAEYDVAMLGDIHLQHVVRNKRHAVTYGYPGSLVQQSFGETTFDHGFLEWIVPSSPSEEPQYMRHHVPNRFGKANAHIEMLEGHPEVFVSTHGRTPLEEFVAAEDLPKHLHMRLYTNKSAAGCTERVLEAIHQITKDRTEVSVDVINAQNSERSASVSADSEVDLSELNRVDTINTFLKEHMCREVKDANPDWFSLVKDPMGFALTPNENHPSRIAEMLHTKNNLIRSAIAKSGMYAEEGASAGTKRFRLLTLRFGWILAFGGDNLFNFEARESLCLINAPNGFGKSAFFEVIILGLFGEVIPSRHNRGTSQSILNKRRLTNTDSSNISIEFMLNEDRYKIRRIFQEQTDKKMVTRLQNRLVELYRNEVLVHSGAKVVSDWMRCNVCGMNDFLLFNMITQNVDMDFIKMSHKDQIEMLDNAFHINYFNHMCEMLKVVRKEYRDLERHMVTHMKAIEPTESLSEEEDRTIEGLEILLKKNNQSLSECRAKLAELIVDERKFLRSDETIPEEALEDLTNRHAHLQSVLKECLSARYEARTYPPKEQLVFLTAANEQLAPLREGLDMYITEAKTLRIAIESEAPFEELDMASVPTGTKLEDLEAELSVTSASVEEGVLEDPPAPPNLSEKEMRDLSDTFTDEIRSMLKNMTAESSRQEALRLERSIEELRASLPPPSDVEPGTDTVDKTRKSVSALRQKMDVVKREIETIEKEHALAAGAAVEIERLNECVKHFDTQLDFDRGGFSAECERCNARKELGEQAKKERAQNVRKRNRLVKKHPNLVQEGGDGRLEHLRSNSEDYQRMIDILERKVLERERRETLKEIHAMQRRCEDLKRFNEFNILARSLKENEVLFRSWNLYQRHRTTMLRIKALHELIRLVAERDRRGLHAARLRRLRTVESLLRRTVAHREGSTRMVGVQEELLGLEKKLSFYAAQKRALMSKTQELELIQRQSREAFLVATTKKKAWHDYEHTKESMSDTLELVTRRTFLFDQVLETIKKYKAWVYNDKFLPVVVQQANEILRTLFEDRDMILKFEFRDETLCWFVQDEGNMIHVEKLSGAQAFAVGLSMRLGLGSMGISKYNCDQLFIDEGFCNFDQTNLARVPTLLARLCGLFRHIVMVTHVEEIKSAAQEVVNIERGNGVSTLWAK